MKGHPSKVTFVHFPRISLSHMFSNVNCTTMNLEKVNTFTAGYFMTGVLMLGTDPTLSFKRYGN